MKYAKFANSWLISGLLILPGCESTVTELGSNASANPEKSPLGTHNVSANAKTVTAVVSGLEHTCAIIEGGVQCWGSNSHGLLGHGDVGRVTGRVPVVNLASGVSALAASESHNCAIAEGKVQCWGFNVSGELGYPTDDVYSAIPGLVAGLPSGVADIAAGDGFTCALVGGGVKCWGANESGQLGNDKIEPSRVPVDVRGLESGVTAIAARSNHACAIANGGVLCWGGRGLSANKLWSSDYDVSTDTSSYTKVPVPIPGLESGVTAIAVSHDHICAIVDGAAKCWGDNSVGQLGNPNAGTGTLVPAQVQGLESDVTAIESGLEHNCAITNDVVQCWGQNGYGQLGNGNNESSGVPVSVSALNGKAWLVASGYFHSCAVVDDGLWCWGENSSSELGNDAAGLKSAVPVEVTSE